MAGFKRVIEAAREEGIDAYYDHVDRNHNPHEDGVLSEAWFEGWDYAADMETMRRPVTEEEIAQMNGYWEDFYSGEKVFA